MRVRWIATWKGGEEGEAREEVEQLLPRHHAFAAAGTRCHGSFCSGLSYTGLVTWSGASEVTGEWCWMDNIEK